MYRSISKARTGLFFNEYITERTSYSANEFKWNKFSRSKNFIES